MSPDHDSDEHLVPLMLYGKLMTIYNGLSCEAKAAILAFLHFAEENPRAVAVEFKITASGQSSLVLQADPPEQG